MSKVDEPGDSADDVDATFEAIVANLRAEGVGAPDSGSRRRERAGETSDGRTDTAPERGTDRAPERGSAPERPEGRPSDWRTADTGWEDTVLGADPANDDEHFVPPEPPPLPRPRKGAFVVLLFFVVGLLLLIAPGVLGLGSSIGLPLGMLALACGIALLLLRVRQGPPDGADPDNGAQV